MSVTLDASVRPRYAGYLENQSNKPLYGILMIADCWNKSNCCKICGGLSFSVIGFFRFSHFFSRGRPSVSLLSLFHLLRWLSRLQTDLMFFFIIRRYTEWLVFIWENILCVEVTMKYSDEEHLRDVRRHQHNTEIVLEAGKHQGKSHLVS